MVFLANEDFKYFRVNKTTYLIFRLCPSQLETESEMNSGVTSIAGASTHCCFILDLKENGQGSLSHVPCRVLELKIIEPKCPRRCVSGRRLEIKFESYWAVT